MESIHFQYPTWYLLICLVAGVAFALALYWRDTSFIDQKRWIRLAMAVLRGITVAVLCALLLAPFLKIFRNTTSDPVIIVAHDNSQSVGAALTGEDSTAYRNALDALRSDLGDKFEVVDLAFGESIAEGSDLDFSEPLTDISTLVSHIGEQYSSENVGAIILATDGLYNSGRNPLYVPTGLNAPMHFIALGDTTTHSDLRIAQVLHNDIAYLGSKFPIQIDVAAENLDARQATLTVSNTQGTILYNESIEITSNDFFQTSEVLLDAATPGVERYRVRLSGIAGEHSYANNARDIFIEVIDGRLNVLLLGDIPHPDLAAFKAAITANENYSVDAFLFDEFEGDPTEYDLVILHSLPSRRTNIETLHTILDRENIPRLYVIGESTSLARLNQTQDLLTVEGSQQKPNEVTAIVDPDFALFTVPENFNAQLRSFAPLSAPFGDFKAAPDAQVYLFQKIGSVDTQFPLMLFGQRGDVKIGVLAAEGIWKWRLYDFLQNENHDLTNTLINKSVQYLTVKDDKRKFRVSPVKNLFTDIEPIGFTAELYNQTYELVNDPDAFLVVTDSAGNAYDFTFSKSDKSYFIDIGRFPLGEYSYRGFTDYGGQRLQASGKFSVKEIQLEMFDNIADHSILYQLADRHGGEVFYPDQLGTLGETLLNDNTLKPVVHSAAQNTPLLNLRWLFLAFLVLLSLEWFMRRYFGGY